MQPGRGARVVTVRCRCSAISLSLLCKSSNTDLDLLSPAALYYCIPVQSVMTMIASNPTPRKASCAVLENKSIVLCLFIPN